MFDKFRFEKYLQKAAPFGFSGSSRPLTLFLLGSVFLAMTSSPAQERKTPPRSSSSSSSSPASNPGGLAMVRVARELLGVKYTLGGRMRGDDGIDCQGVLFYAAEQLQPRRRKCGWKSFSVMPTKTLRDREFGSPVPKLSPVTTSKLDLQRMKPGDIIFFLDVEENPAEPALATLEGEKVWVWHTALYAGSGNMISGDPFYGKVVEVALLPYLQEHPYAGVFILRPSTRGPRPKKCRKHPPMTRRKPKTPTKTSTPPAHRR